MPRRSRLELVRPSFPTRRQMNLHARVAPPGAYAARPEATSDAPPPGPPSPAVGRAPSPWTIAARLARMLLACAVVTLALVGLLSLTRGTPIERVGTLGTPGTLPSVGAPGFARLVELYTGASLAPGHRVELLTDGDGTYPRLWADLRAARRSITLQLYYGQPGAVADTMGLLLAAKAREGVSVHVVLDDFGVYPLPHRWDDALRTAGARVERLREMRWHTLDRLGSRSHVRAVVVDGVVGYTGGFGMADYWLGAGHAPSEWRETNVRFEGPAVVQLQAAFAIAWAEATGELLAGEPFFPPTARHEALPGDVRAALAFTRPTPGSTPAERLLALSIAGAQRTLYVTNSYFLPDDDFRRLLVGAAQRGVDVRVLTASTRTDIRSVYWASHWRYEPLLRAGVRIYEYQPSMMHAKTLVADGEWSIVGSMNFDNRSLALNDEANLVVLDRRVGASLDSIFRHDLGFAREVRVEAFLGRPLWQRAVEIGAALLSRVL
ncbi:MAG: phospholipase D-like domain-containing protein [Gemmatirosa sp.]